MLSKLIDTVIGSDGKPMLVDVSYPNDIDSICGHVIFVHGYKGFKDWGAWGQVAEAFARAGYCFIKFNFSHNGTTLEAPDDFADLEAFGRNNYSKECDDLITMIDWVLNSGKIPGDPKEVSLIGHSRGGGISILVASEHWAVDQLITWASVSDFADRFLTGRELENWEESGVYHILNGRTGQEMPHYFQWYQDYQLHEARLNIQERCQSLDIPVFIIQALDDEAVDPIAAAHLNQWCQNSERWLLEKGGHTFGAKHPWTLNVLPEPLDAITEASIKFLKK